MKVTPKNIAKLRIKYPRTWQYFAVKNGKIIVDACKPQEACRQ